MKIIIVLITALMLTGCAKQLTRLMPKLDKIELPEELMKPPQELKTINKPEAPSNVTPE